MASSQDKAQVLLYDHPVSSYAQKIRIALREKGVTFKSVVPDSIKLGKPEAAFRDANPRLQVPTLIDGDDKIFDSTIIMEYIEDKWPEPPLLPKSPAARAKARKIEDVCDTTYESINWAYGEIAWFERASGELAEKLKGEVIQQTQVLQAWLTEHLGDSNYLNSDQFGWADIAAGPIVNRSVNYGFAPEKGSPLDKWLGRIKQHDSVKATFAEFDEAVVNIPKMGPMFKSGERKREYRDHRLEWLVKSGGIDIVLDGLKDNNIRFSWPDAKV